VTKRAFDLVVAASALVLLAPLLIIVAIWITLDSSGSPFFRQVRVGRHGIPFRIVKFRTMHVGSHLSGALITASGDVRVTSAGRFLRRFKLDELPQLWNVLRGEMSIVGPRPEVPQYVDLYPPSLKWVVLSVRPGITDPAAIRYMEEEEILARYKDSEEAYRTIHLPRKVRLYVEYVQDQSFSRDFRIILATAGRLLLRRPREIPPD
jgi:lipopolysaccharide/colanic/teichoic acid biosynthesis glycosyltransferase